MNANNNGTNRVRFGMVLTALTMTERRCELGQLDSVSDSLSLLEQQVSFTVSNVSTDSEITASDLRNGA